MQRFRNVLIANRGEIAVRIIKACRELGLATVAVYSEADAGAFHVREADEAVAIGPPPASASYLNIPGIIAAARSAGADAVHPGYGFLSENPALAEVCEAAGLIFVGPPAAAIRAMADKSAAKRLAQRLGVPVLPGYHGRAQTDARLINESAAVGFPLLVKAAAGGGGRGMRIVGSAEDLPEALAGARREAQAAFGDGRLLLERYLERPRHIEVQVLADGRGHIVTLGERECSLQRRHQKVMEEAPAPNLPEATRAGLCAAALRLAGAIGYVNAGTVEFLVDAAGGFYFLEMNTRLQVEHGVTEMVWGVDIVQQQLRIAQGEPLPWAQADLRPRGHAIECRLAAEDATRAFAPSPGRLALVRPPAGPGVRIDTGVETGDEVSRFYDPMFAKLLVWGETRDAALERARHALADYAVLGVTTNLPLLQHLAEAAAVREGRLSTQLLDQTLLAAFQEQQRPINPESLLAAAAWEHMSAADRPYAANPWVALGDRRSGGRRVFAYDQGLVELVPSEGGWTATIDGVPYAVNWRRIDDSAIAFEVDSVPHRALCAATATGIGVFHHGRAHDFRKPRPAGFTGATRAVAHGQRGLTAPMPAVVVRVLVKPGDQVRARQTLVVLEAMKMEHLIQSPTAGVVRRVRCAEGATVAEGVVLVEVGE
ncbi:MAG: acetyl-CoA carboxylase biotin carboxylase subunit [Dehalococcoidia bacterium]|nr:acetyl-CoA carboxylase biotin carboxylase subunit [Dehalococcoidia bacterium]